MADDHEVNIDSDRQMPKKYYGISFIVMLICIFIYMIPHWEHYMMGGMQGMILLFILLIILLIVLIIGMFILAAILRKVMKKPWGKFAPKLIAGAMVIFLAVNIYRSTLPLPYLKIMIDKIPDAVEYFEANEADLYAQTMEGKINISYSDDSLPIGPMINILYVYVESVENYPQQTGQISRTSYIYPLNEHWYLLLFQQYAS